MFIGLFVILRIFCELLLEVLFGLGIVMNVLIVEGLYKLNGEVNCDSKFMWMFYWVYL